MCTSVANLASVRACFDRLERSYVVSRCPSQVAEASHLIIPGVGALAPCVESLRAAGVAEMLRARLRSNRPTMGICLGMQLMGLGSQESPGISGLGLIERHARRFSDSCVVPQMGWNRVLAPRPSRVFRSGYAYFANSYRWDVGESPDEWAVSNYGGPFVAGFERGNIVGCQFHPELSGAWGMELIARFLELEAPC